MADAATIHAMDQYLGQIEELVVIGYEGCVTKTAHIAAEVIATRVTKMKRRDTTLLLVLALTQMSEDRYRAEHASV